MGLNNTWRVKSRSAENLQQWWGGVRMCAPFCVHTPVPVTEISDWTFHTSGLWVQILIEHRTLSFCRPFTFFLIGAQRICDASSAKEYPGNLRGQGIVWNILILGRSSRERCRSLLFSDLWRKLLQVTVSFSLILCCLDLGVFATHHPQASCAF